MLGYCYFDQCPSLLLSGSSFFLSVWVSVGSLFLSGFSFSLIGRIFLSVFSLSLLPVLSCQDSLTLLPVVSYQDFLFLLPAISFCWDLLYCKRYFFTVGWAFFSVAFFRHLA